MPKLFVRPLFVYHKLKLEKHYLQYSMTSQSRAIRSQIKKIVKFVEFGPLIFFNCESMCDLTDVTASINDSKIGGRLFYTRFFLHLVYSTPIGNGLLYTWFFLHLFFLEQEFSTPIFKKGVEKTRCRKKRLFYTYFSKTSPQTHSQKMCIVANVSQVYG